MIRKTLIVSSVVLAFSGAAWAQTPLDEPDPTRFRVRFGPLLMNPTLSLTNMGIDTNVFNEPAADHPKSDFTLTVTPQTELWLRLGRTWLTGNIKEDVVYFKRYVSERSANNNYTVGWLVPLTRVSFNVNGNLVRTRERPGFEIDARSERTEKAVNGAVEVRALSRTLFGVRGERRQLEFDEAAVFLSRNLRNELSRTTTAAAITVRHELTPLTSLTLDLAREEERFDVQRLRDSETTRVTAGLRFDPYALVSGTATVGFRSYEPQSPDVPEFNGTTLRANLTYSLLGSTKFTVDALRDVEHSFDINQPYFLQTGFSASMAQRIYGPVDLVGRFGRQRLSYRDREGTTVEAPDRLDRVRTYGGGIGYRLGRDLRIGVNVDRQERLSAVLARRYEGLRYGIAVTYGQ